MILRLYHEQLNLKGKALPLQSHIPPVRPRCGDESTVALSGNSFFVARPYSSKNFKTEQAMNRTEIEQAVLREIHSLPLDKVEATLNFVLSLKNKPVKKRPLGLLKGKVEFAIDENFKMTDEEFLQS